VTEHCHYNGRVARGTRIDSETTQLTIRVSRRVALRAERLIEQVGRSLGVPATRTDVIREAILRGLDVLEREAAGDSTRRPALPASQALAEALPQRPHRK
jgi:hypothetical protein